MTNLINTLKAEFLSYPKNMRIAIGIMVFLGITFMISASRVWLFGLGVTDMSNLYPFGQWIIGDLGLVALGGGAFTSGFLLYIFRNDKLNPIINSTVMIGFLCYLFTFVYLVLDIGQPLRAWFGYVYPNWGGIRPLPESMLTEVVWCLTIYFVILIIELIPVPLKHRILDRVTFLNRFGHYLHKLMWIVAAAGTFFSFFHQGSLGGGMWGELYAKVGWYRGHFFFLAIAGAVAAGTSFMALWTYIAGKIMKKEVVPVETLMSLAKISGIAYVFYLAFRLVDLYTLAVVYAPTFERSLSGILGGFYGWWMYGLEIILGIAAIIMLFFKKFREQEKFRLAGWICAVGSVTIHKIIIVLWGSSIPNFPWREYNSYNPTLDEWTIMLGGLSIMVLIYMAAARYLPLFPHLEKQKHHDEDQH